METIVFLLMWAVVIITAHTPEEWEKIINDIKNNIQE